MKLEKYSHPLVFYGVSILAPWFCWFILAWISNSPLWGNEHWVLLGSIIGLIGLCGPFAIAMILILPDADMRAELFSALFNFKNIKIRYWILALLLFPSSILLAQAISLPFGHSVDQFRFVEHMSFSAGIFPAWFLLALAPILEELGWHTYGIHCIRNRFNLLITCLIFGVIWGTWHMPLSFVKGYYQNVLVETGILYSINFLVSLIPYLIIENWLYYKTNRNMLMIIVFHFLAGFSNEIFRTHPDSKVIQTGLLLVFSALLLWKEKKFFFTKSPDGIV